jgi:hypothetical protein
MQEQERDLLRDFRARLFDVQTELEKEKSKKDDGAIAWIERSRQLESEVEWAKEVADRLERVNQSLLQVNAKPFVFKICAITILSHEHEFYRSMAILQSLRSINHINCFLNHFIGKQSVEVSVYESGRGSELSDQAVGGGQERQR